MKTSCVILAAGKSERMGELKPFLRFRENLTFLQKIIQVYHNQHIYNLVIVVSDEVHRRMQKSKSELNYNKVIINPFPEWGRFYSLKLVLQEIRDDSFVYLQNIDNPFVTEKTLQSLKNEICDSDFAVPIYERQSGHPILLSAEVVTKIIQTEENNSNLRSILSSFRKREVELNDPGILININTPDDYLKNFPEFQK
jgi:molybdenum cofactor cytidylyltransferase